MTSIQKWQTGPELDKTLVSETLIEVMIWQEKKKKIKELFL